MKVARVVIVVALAASLIGNYVLWRRTLSMRTHVKIGAKDYSKRLFYAWLEQRYGKEVTAEIARYELVMQGAEKAGIKVDKQEIDEAFQDAIDSKPDQAIQFKQRPWLVDEWKREAERTLATIALATKDVPATDDQLRDHFTQNPGKFDKPDKIYFKAIAAESKDTADKAKELMQKVSDVTVLRQQLEPQGRVMGVDGTLMIRRRPGGKIGDPKLDEAANSPDGTVTEVPASVTRFLVLKKVKIVPGKKVTFEEVKDKVARDFKGSRMTPPTEVLRKLWDSTPVDTEDPGMKADLERILFPERAGVTAAATRR